MRPPPRLRFRGILRARPHGASKAPQFANLGLAVAKPDACATAEAGLGQSVWAGSGAATIPHEAVTLAPWPRRTNSRDVIQQRPRDRSCGEAVADAGEAGEVLRRQRDSQRNLDPTNESNSRPTSVRPHRGLPARALGTPDPQSRPRVPLSMERSTLHAQSLILALAQSEIQLGCPADERSRSS